MNGSRATDAPGRTAGHPISIAALLILILAFLGAAEARAQWPINYEANRRHMFSYDAIVLKGADYFLMMNRPDEFNRALEQAIRMILQKR